MQLNTGIDFLPFIGELLHAGRRVDLGIERRATGQRPFGDIFRAQRGNISHGAKIAVREHGKIVLHVDAGAVNVRVVARRRIAEVLRLDLAPVNGGAGNRNAKLFAGGFSRAGHVV